MTIQPVHTSGAHGRRADEPRRAWIRHLLPSAEDRIVFLGTPIDDNVGNLIMASSAPGVRGPDKDINLYINSPGGDVSALLAIYDTMQYIKCDVPRS